MRNKYGIVILFGILAVAGSLLVSCGGGSSSSSQGSSGQTANVTTTISDPATCGPPQGPFSHIYVTVNDVQINQSASAGNNDSGWVDLTPNLKNKPVQVDLLGMSNQCAVQTLDTQAIPAGNYQQIRVILANTGAGLSSNKCGTAANCVMLSNDLLNTPIPLLLSSETTTGIKIPSGQITGGQLAASPRGTQDFNIDFNACASIVMQGNQQYRLNPVLHAAEVNLLVKPISISGTVVDAATGQPVAGGTTVVALEQADSSGVDRVFMETVTGSNGIFAFCPLPPGNFDVVVSAINAQGTVYAASVITGVGSGSDLGNVPVVAVGAPATISGVVTSSTGTAATAADIRLAALQAIIENVNGSPTQVMITTPLAALSAATLSLPTAPGSSCPTQTDCNSYTFTVPATTPGVGAFTQGSDQKLTTPPIAGTTTYTVDGTAFVPGAATQTGDCSPSELTGAVVVNPGAPSTAPTLNFSGCQ